MATDVLELLGRIATSDADDSELVTELHRRVEADVSRLAPYLEQIFAPVGTFERTGDWPDLSTYADVAELLGRAFEMELVELYLRVATRQLASTLSSTVTERGVDRLLEALVVVREPGEICEVLANVDWTRLRAPDPMPAGLGAPFVAWALHSKCPWEWPSLDLYRPARDDDDDVVNYELLARISRGGDAFIARLHAVLPEESQRLLVAEVAAAIAACGGEAAFDIFRQGWPMRGWRMISLAIVPAIADRIRDALAPPIPADLPKVLVNFAWGRRVVPEAVLGLIGYPWDARYGDDFQLDQRAWIDARTRSCEECMPVGAKLVARPGETIGVGAQLTRYVLAPHNDLRECAQCGALFRWEHDTRPGGSETLVRLTVEVSALVSAHLHRDVAVADLRRREEELFALSRRLLPLVLTYVVRHDRELACALLPRMVTELARTGEAWRSDVLISFVRTPDDATVTLEAIEHALGDRPLPPRFEALGRACRALLGD